MGDVAPAPVDFVAGEATTSTIAFSWTAPEGTVDGYRVEYSVSQSDVWTDAGVLTDTAAVLTDLDPDTAYDLRIWGYLNGADSVEPLVGTMSTAASTPSGSSSGSPSPSVSESPTDQPPASAASAPTGFVALATGMTTIGTMWDAATDDATVSYRLDYATSADGPWTEVPTAATTTTLDELLASTTYYVRVAGCDLDGLCSEPTAAQAVTTEGPAPVADPEKTATAYVPTDLAVLANDPEGATLAAISTAPGHGTATIEGTKIRYTADLRYHGTDTLQYTIDGSSTPATVTIDVAAYVFPPMTSSVGVTRSSLSTITWAWTAAEGVSTHAIAGYRLEFKPVDSEAEPTTITTTALTYTAEDLPSGTEYEWRFVTVDTAGQPSTGQSANASTWPAPPATPTGLTALATGDSTIGLIWDEMPESAWYYKLSYSTSADGPWTGSTSFWVANATLDGLTPVTRYYVRVAACDTNDSCSPFSSPVSATTDGRAPVDDEAVAHPDFEQAIDVFANDPDSPSTATLITPPAHGTATFDRGLFHYVTLDNEATSDSFTYRNDVSQETATVTITITPVVTPAEPTDLAFTRPDATHITLTWTAPTNMADLTFGPGTYLVQLCPVGEACGPTTELDADTTTATLEIDPQATYYAYVYPRDAYNGGHSDARILVTPEAGDDSATVLDHGTWAIDVLANDAGSPTTATVVTQPTLGTVSFQGGKFQYTATTTGAGSDSFTYRNDISDTIATVTITVDEAVAPTFTSTILRTPDVHSVLVEWDPAIGESADIAGYRVFIQERGTGTWTKFTDTEDPEVTSVEVTGLDSSTDYRFYVQAYDELGLFTNRTSSYTTTLFEPGTVDAVDDLQASNVTTTTVDLAWTEPASTYGIDGYEVSYSVAGENDWTYFDYVTGTAVTVDGLASGTAYDFKVVAWDVTEDDEPSDDSNIATLSTVYVQPGDVTDLAATPGPTTLDLSWTEPQRGSAAVDHYVVHVKKATDESWTEVPVEAPATGTQLTGLDTNTRYDIVVTVVDANEHESEGSYLRARTLWAVVNLATEVSTSNATATTMDVSWAAAERGTNDILGYIVVYAPAADQENMQQTDVIADGTSTTIRGLIPGTDYLFMVVTADVEFNVAYSLETSLALGTTLPAVLPGTPISVAIGGTTDRTMDVSWTAGETGTDEIDHFVVTAQPMEGDPVVQRTEGATTELTLTGLTPDTAYEVSVVAVDTADRESASSNPANGSTGYVRISAPTGMTVTGRTTTSLTVAWDAPVGESSYPLASYIVWWFDGTRWVYADPTEGSTFTVEGLAPATGYQVRVTARDAAGVDSVESAFVEHETAAVAEAVAPSTPTGVSVTARTGNYEDVRWAASTPGSNESVRYEIQYRTLPDGEWTFLGNTDATQLESDVWQGYVQEYRVRAIDADEMLSGWSEPVRLDVLPFAPVDVEITGTTTSSLDVAWTAPERTQWTIDHYRVLVRPVGAEVYLEAGTTTGTSFTIEELDANADYDVAVEAVDAEGLHSAQSTTTGSTDAELPPAPLRPQVSTPDAVVTGGSALVEVSGVSDAATVRAGELAAGVAGVDVNGLTVTVRTVHGFSGQLVQTLLVADGGDPVEVEATVVVNPDPAERATYRMVSATGSRVQWTAAAGATGYVVKVGGTMVCTTSAAACLVPRLLGPASVVTVTATGHDGTIATTARATWVSAAVNFGHVHFVGDSPTLMPTSATYLRTLTAKLMAAGVTRVTIHGYTATQGTATRTPVQLRLSAMRANAVAAYMSAYYAAHGKALRVVRVAEGATRPIASNATGSGRAENRRAEVVLG